MVLTAAFFCEFVLPFHLVNNAANYKLQMRHKFIVRNTLFILSKLFLSKVIILWKWMAKMQILNF